MKIRIRFSKKGPVKFIGHLDILRYFQKAFRRAGLDLCYSQGFHPHPVLSFASPLGVGLESEGEYMDLEVHTLSTPEKTLADLNAQMAEGIRAEQLSMLRDDAKNSMSILAAADYRVRFREGMMPCSPQELEKMICAFLECPEIPVVKKTKKNELKIDIRPMIYRLFANEEGEILMQAAAGSSANLKPELVVETMFSRAGIRLDPYSMMITRLEMFAADPGRGLISLGDYQTADGEDAAGSALREPGL